MQELSAGAQGQAIAQRELFRVIDTHLLKRQVMDTDGRLAHDERSLRALSQYASRQPNGRKGARGATLIAHLTSEQQTANSTESLVIGNRSGRRIREIRSRPGCSAPLVTCTSPRARWARGDSAAGIVFAADTSPWRHCKMVRVAAEERSTHFQSSGSARASDWRRKVSSDEKSESTCTRNSVVRLATTLTCCSMAGKKPGNDTRSEYFPGFRRSVKKAPCWLDRSCETGRPPASSERSHTVAPI